MTYCWINNRKKKSNHQPGDLGIEEVVNTYQTGEENKFSVSFHLISLTSLTQTKRRVSVKLFVGFLMILSISTKKTIMGQHSAYTPFINYVQYIKNFKEKRQLCFLRHMLLYLLSWLFLGYTASVQGTGLNIQFIKDLKYKMLLNLTWYKTECFCWSKMLFQLFWKGGK